MVYQWISRIGIPPKIMEAITKKVNFILLNFAGLILFKRHSPSDSLDMYLS
jgi:hypothetical protein